MVAHPHSPHEATLPTFTRLARWPLIALLVVVCLGSPSTFAESPPAQFYVEPTGHALAGPFLRYWLDNNGSKLLGLPVTEVFKVDGLQTQYFQYGALAEPSKNSIARLKAGVNLLKALQSTSNETRRLTTPQFNPGDATSQVVHQTIAFDSKTPLAVDAQLLTYWTQLGGAASLGKPISSGYRDGNLRVQWFEFGRIEAGDYGGELAEVGLELAGELQLPTAPADQGNLPLFDPARFVVFQGDGFIPNANEPFDPTRLQIPKIKVDAGIEVTTVTNGVMTNPVDPWKAGWYQSFTRPGEWSNTVIAGHRDWWGYGPVVFWDLGWLLPGDKVYLTGADGSGATYVVSEVLVVPRTVDPQTIINDVGYEALTLITCGGTWTGTEYTDRIIVRAYRI